MRHTFTCFNLNAFNFIFLANCGSDSNPVLNGTVTLSFLIFLILVDLLPWGTMLVTGFFSYISVSPTVLLYSVAI